jgi:hypothetical protein
MAVVCNVYQKPKLSQVQCEHSMITGPCKNAGSIRRQENITEWCWLLWQVGSFYECAGIDAIILAEWCGLNFMGTGTPKAGLPLDNVHMVLGQLRERGLQVVSVMSPWLAMAGSRLACIADSETFCRRGLYMALIACLPASMIAHS